MQYWLMKSEPGDYSIDDLEKDKQAMWDGVRNYQARNLMRDTMEVGDKAFFYHSNTDPIGVVGLMEIATESYDDPTQFDPKDSHFDPKSKKEAPTWQLVDVKFIEKFERVVTLQEIKEMPACKDMVLINRSRLSVQTVTKKEFDAILKAAHT